MSGLAKTTAVEKKRRVRRFKREDENIRTQLNKTYVVVQVNHVDSPT
jgi:hypothetical protein